MIVGDHPSEMALSGVWQAQRFRGPLRTTDGRIVEVVHRGTWTHGFGPDFRDAMVLFEGRELRGGSVEIHLRTGAWTAHGHHVDGRYDDVVLHVVLRHDGSETRRSDGAVVPVVALEASLIEPLDAVQPRTTDWSRFGDGICAFELARREPGRVRAILWRLGDARIAAKAARLEARLTVEPPAEVLYYEVWDGLGFSANRAPMRSLATLLPLSAIEGALGTVRDAHRLAVARGLLFGAGGFLPMAPADAAIARMEPDETDVAEVFWARLGGPWHGEALPPTTWTRARVRPANHPVARLAAGAALLAGARGGLLSELLAPVRSAVDPVGTLRELTTVDGHPLLGIDRATGIVANAVLPLAFALAEHTGDQELADAAAGAWEHLSPAEANEVTRRAHRQVAGDARLPGLGARGQQGLIQLDSTLCAPRRCFECPVARAVAENEAPDTRHREPDGRDYAGGRGVAI